MHLNLHQHLALPLFLKHFVHDALVECGMEECHFSEIICRYILLHQLYNLLYFSFLFNVQQVKLPLLYTFLRNMDLYLCYSLLILPNNLVNKFSNTFFLGLNRSNRYQSKRRPNIGTRMYQISLCDCVSGILSKPHASCDAYR